MKPRSFALSALSALSALASLLLTLGTTTAATDIAQAATTSGSPATNAAVSGDVSDLAKQSQNPVADLISLPFQNNTNFNVGPGNDAQNVLNIQPVIPVNLTKDWNVINRFIAPLIYQPDLGPGVDKEFGFGDLQYTAFLSPAKPGKLIWGFGPVIQLDTATDDVLGTGKYNLGPSAVLFTMPGNWTLGVLAQNVWSIAGDDDRDNVNTALIQPIINYNMAHGWYLASVPVITANWQADSDQRWTVPIGGGIGRVFHIGDQPVNATIQGYANIITPDTGADWTLRAQLTFLFPKG